MAAVGGGGCAAGPPLQAVAAGHLSRSYVSSSQLELRAVRCGLFLSCNTSQRRGHCTEACREGCLNICYLNFPMPQSSDPHPPGTLGFFCLPCPGRGVGQHPSPTVVPLGLGSCAPWLYPFGVRRGAGSMEWMHSGQETSGTQGLGRAHGSPGESSGEVGRERKTQTESWVWSWESKITSSLLGISVSPSASAPTGS